MPKIAPADAAGAMAAAEAKGKELLKDAEARATAMAPEAMALAKAGAAAGNALFAKGQAAMFGSISEAGVPPPQVIQSPTLQFEGKMYHKRPKFQRPERSKLELSPCGLCCCWNPDQDMFYNDPATFMIFGEKDSKRCCGCCFCMTGPGYVGKEGNDTLGTLTPWMMPCCFCCQSTPQMVDPSDPEGKRKTWYVPTAHLAGPDGNPLYETRIRSPDLNCCASCKACCRCTPCKCCAGCALQCCTCKCQSCCDNFCGPCLLSRCGGCFACCKSCSTDCRCSACAGLCLSCGNKCKFCAPYCEQSCVPFYECCMVDPTADPLFSIGSQPIFKPGKDNKEPVGSIDTIWSPTGKAMTTLINVPGTSAAERKMLALYAWVLLERSDGDISKPGFIHDLPVVKGQVNPFFETRREGVEFSEVIQLISGSKGQIGSRPPDQMSMARDVGNQILEWSA